MAKSEKISGRMINGEYWSNEALEEKPVEQLYPQLEDEPTEEYERRIGEIAAIMSEDDSTPLPENAGEAVGASDEAVKKRISKKIGNAPFRHAIDPKLVHKDDRAYGLEAQEIREEKAEKYLKILGNMTTVPIDYADVEGLSSSKIASDQRYVENREFQISMDKSFLSPEKREMEDQAEKREKTIEALLYPMIINYGLFDDPEGRRGQVYYPSRYDDLSHGIDVGLGVPLFYKDKSGNIHRGFELITLDCTTAESASGILKKLNHTSDDGLTDFDYAKDESGALIHPGKVPNFTIAVSRTTIDKALTKDGLEGVAKVLRVQLCHQIKLQANLRMEYIAKHRTLPRPDSKTLSKEDFQSEEDLETYRTMLRIKRTMDVTLQRYKYATSKQTELVQDAVTIKSNDYKNS